MRFRCALLAGLLAGGASSTARADDPPDDLRETFGLKKPPPNAAASCGDGLAFDCAIATDPLGDATPYALSSWLPASYLLRLPVADATHDGIASYALGASRDEAGPVFGGATGLENRWTVDGAPADNIRTGAADTRLPLAFLEGVRVTAGGFSARDRASTGGTIDAQLRRGTPHHELMADVWTGASLARRERPIASASYTVRQASFDTGPDATALLVATGPFDALAAPLGGTVWYVAGVAPNLSTTTVSWRASRLVDANNDGIPDGLPGVVAIAPIEDTDTRTLDYFVPAIARLGLDRGPHHVELSLVGQVQHDAAFLANSTLQAAGIDRTSTVGDAIATWRGVWATTHARAQLAWHRSSRHESARDPAAAGIPQLLSAYVPTPLPDDPVLAAACDDAAPLDPAKLIANCQVPFGFFASGGAGLLTDTVGDRPSASADLAHRIGNHVVRAGAAFEDTRLVTTSTFTSGEQQRSLFVGQLSRRRFYHGNCVDAPGAPCDYATGSELSYRTVYAAAYAEDTFSPRDGLAIDGGLRWELMWVGTRLHFSNQLAPRAGVTWDPLGGGRSRLWASAGRTFAMLPAGLGATVIQRDATVDDIELGAPIGRSHDAGAAFHIVPGIAPIEQDEIALGAEVALAGALRATLWGQGRFLRHGIETTADGLDNPGKNGDIAATRETEVVALAIEMRQLERIAIRAGVMWGRTVGTWAGPYDPQFGANLLQSPAWDADASNLYGPLPTDPGSRLFVEAERRGALGTVDLAVATRLTVGSGRPRDVLADGADGVVALLPRGTAGRDPVIAQANLRLAARWRGFTATLDVFNVFDRRDATNLDEVFSSDDVRPVEGGSYRDLVFLKNDTGAPARRRTSYQLPTAFQPPLAISLGVHRVF